MKTLMLGIALVGSFAGALAGAATSPVLNPGTPDAAIMTYVPALGRAVPIQLDYLSLVNRPDIVVFEDGSIETRAQFERARYAYALRTLKPTGSTFLPTGIEATTDR